MYTQIIIKFFTFYIKNYIIIYNYQNFYNLRHAFSKKDVEV